MSAGPPPSGIITLLTDFGVQDPFVGVMKGVILSRFQAARIVDLTHGIEPQSVAEAAFWLGRSTIYFPTGTIHVAVVDPGVGTERAALAALVNGQYFLAPDNGLLDSVLNSSMDAEVRSVSSEYLRSIEISAVSRTFHGRDVFAPIAAELAAGRTQLKSIGPSATRLAPAALTAPVVGSDRVEGFVVTIDRFGNLITNIDALTMSRFRSVTVEIAGRQFPLLGTYHEASAGDFLALINAFGVLEIARVDGSAARALGIHRGHPVLVREREAE